MESMKNIVLLSSVSPFRKRVYLELLNTKAGEAITYGELARRLGYKNASFGAMAVGQALKHNPWPYGWLEELPDFCVPCHRVIGHNGTIGGYMGATSGDSVDRKRDILLHEGANI